MKSVDNDTVVEQPRRRYASRKFGPARRIPPEEVIARAGG